MSTQISIAQAKATFAALIAKAEAGEDIVVTRNGRPVARLGPIAKGTVTYGDLEGIYLADDLSLPDDVAAAFEDRS